MTNPRRQPIGSGRVIPGRSERRIGSLVSAVVDPGRSSETKYRRLYESMRDGFASTDMEGRILEFNEAYREMLGYGAEELLSLNYRDITPEKWGSLEEKIIREQVLQHGHSEVYRKEYRRKDGTVIPVELRTVLIKDENGVNTGMWAIVRDITERTRTEEALRESEKRFKNLVEQSPLSIQIFDPKGRTLQINRSWEKLWGISLADLGDYNILEDKQLEKRGLMSYIRKGFSGQPTALPPIEYDVTNTLGRGTRRWVRASIYPVRDERQQISNVILMHEDITEQKRSEEALQESEAKFRTLFLVQPDAIILLNADNMRILDVNEVCLKMYGYAREEFLALKSIMEVSAEPEATCKIVQSTRTEEIVLGQKSQHKRKDGSLFSVEISARGFRLREERVLFVAIRDITERLEIEKELQHAKEEAESASRIKSEFLDIAAHELRTPLTTLTLLIERVQQLTKDGKPIPMPYLERLVQQDQRLTGLIDDLLNASRLEREGLALHLARADLGGLIREAVEDFRRRNPERKIAFELPKGEVFLEMDANRICQVLENLLDNAVKYTPESSAIDITMAVTGLAVRVAVADHGPGIPKEKQKQLFSRFARVTADATIRHSGLGLGLYISRRIVELHGGTIGVDSEPGQGSSFYFTLPRK